MIRTIIWFVYFWVYMLGTIPMLIRLRRLDKAGNTKERDELVNRAVTRWAKSLVKLTGSNIKITGEENIPDGPVVFIGNHQGNFDVPIFLGLINKPKAFIAKIETAKLPLVSTWMRYMRCVFMDRNDIRQSLKAMKEGIENIKEGYSLVIFPEGTRSRGDEMGEFKAGSFKLAVKSGVPIVPVTTRGSYKIMEQNGFIIKPADVEVIISEPIYTKGMCREEIETLPDRVKSIIQEKL
jgi:1-acyl-sn-glycerol-3-phosphate acyltransferases